jgi:hypothetical protein
MSGEPVAVDSDRREPTHAQRHYARQDNCRSTKRISEKTNRGWPGGMR